MGRVASEARADFKNTTSTWKGERNFGKTICVDLDGVIFSMKNGWLGPDKFGSYIPGASLALRELKKCGWYIALFTTRLVTAKLVRHLKKYRIVYDDINGRCFVKNGTLYVRLQRYNRSIVDYKPAHRRWFWSHNPEWASVKPIASIYLDDHAWPRIGEFDARTWGAVVHDLKVQFP